MKTDIYAISNDKATIKLIFEEVEKSAKYNGLEKKNYLQLRLLTEELLGMLSELLNVGTGEFWIENNGNNFELHATIKTKKLSAFDRENILSVSKSGKNAASKGIINKIKLITEGMIDGYFNNSHFMGDNDYYIFYDMGTVVSNTYYNAWSLNSYKEYAEENKDTDVWDELEKSIIANIADDVIVGVIGKNVDIIIKKKFV